MRTRPESGKTRAVENRRDAETGRRAVVSEAIPESPKAALCHLKRCVDCLRHALAQDIARHFKELTGLVLHLQHGVGAVPWCPDAERLRLRNSAKPQRCAICAEDIWQAATREKTHIRVFDGVCGRMNCWLCISASGGCALSLVIQTPKPQTAVSRSSEADLKPTPNPAEAPDPVHAGRAKVQASCRSTLNRPPVSEAFGQAVTLLKIVARGLESILEAEDLRHALDEAQRAQQAVFARDTRLRRVLKKRLPELSEEPVLPENAPQADRLVDQVRDFVLKNYQRPIIGLGEAGASVHRSASYISTLFARKTGVSFHSYLQELRLAKARELLRDPCLTVDEVAQASGYASVGWFRHSFKRHVGLSPSDWRRSHLHH